MPFYSVDDGTKIYYEETGKDKKETVLIIHGLGSSHFKLKNFINEFKSDYHVNTLQFAMIIEDMDHPIVQRSI